MNLIRTIPDNWFEQRQVTLAVLGGAEAYHTLDYIQLLSAFSDLFLHLTVSPQVLNYLRPEIFTTVAPDAEFSEMPSENISRLLNETGEMDALVILDFRRQVGPAETLEGELTRFSIPVVYIRDENSRADQLPQHLNTMVYTGEWSTPLERLASLIPGDSSWSGKTVLVTAGRTEESLDPVRMITNKSTGKMGFALARQAHLRGAETYLVTGPVALRTPEGVHRIDVRTADQMLHACQEVFDEIDVMFAAAAVEDLKPVAISENKIKKQHRISLECESTVDVLSRLASNKTSQRLIGFSVETENALENSEGKMHRKSLDAIVINNPREPGAAFQHDTNKVTFLTRDGSRVDLPLMSKEVLAIRLLDQVNRTFYSDES